MTIDQLKPGDILFCPPTTPIGEAIVAVTGGRFSHVGQVVPGGEIAHMASPRGQRLPAATWLRENGPAFVGVLKTPLTRAQEIRLESVWEHYYGEIYDYLLLFRLAGITWWQKLCLRLGWTSLAKIQPWTLGNVCSTAVAQASKAAGLPVDETTGMTPEDLCQQSFLQAIQPLDAA